MLVNIHRNKETNAVVKVNLIRCFYLSAPERRTDGRGVFMAWIWPRSVEGIHGGRRPTSVGYIVVGGVEEGLGGGGGASSTCAAVFSG